MSIDQSFRIPSRDWARQRLDFRVFAGKDDFLDQTRIALDEVISKITEKKVRDWFEDNAEYKKYFDQARSYKDYEYFSDLQRYINAFEEIFATIDMGGAFKKSRLKITDDKRGIFSFSLASKGLYKPQEYFSQEIANDNLPEFEFSQYPSGIVPVKLVKQQKVLGILQFYYKSESGKEYLLTKQDEGTRAIELQLPDAKKVYKTSNKKSYLMFEKRGGKAKMVELYFPIHANVKLNHIFPLMLAARYFQSMGIKTRINVMRMYGGDGSFVGWSYPIKDYDDELDMNSIALQGVDDRWWWAMRAGVCAIHDAEKTKGIPVLNSDWGMWNGAGSPPGSRADYVAFFSRYRNWYRQEIDAGRLQPLQVDKKLILVGGTYNIGKYEDITQPEVKKKVLEEFFRIIDLVDFQFNKPDEVCRRIYKRLVDDETEEYYQQIKNQYSSSQQNELIARTNEKRRELTLDYKIHIQGLLTDTYTYPKGGQYAEPSEDAEKMEDEYDAKMEAMSQFLQTL